MHRRTSRQRSLISLPSLGASLSLAAVLGAVGVASGQTQTPPPTPAQPPASARQPVDPDAQPPREPTESENAATPSQDTEAGEESAEGDMPDVIAPQVEHYEPPVYPPEAFKQGLEAEVRLLITVNVDGSVSDPEVVEPQGHGFDEAAIAAAKLLKFSPALVQGEPRAVRIGYQYSFTVDEAEETAAPAEQQATVGAMGGVLLIAATETPLPGAQVVLTDALGNEYTTTTDENGKWSIEALTPGKYQVVIDSEGFVAVNSPEEVEAGSITEITYRMYTVPAEDEVVVQGERPPREMTKRTVSRREISRIPGTNGDALRSIQSLPGVARPPGLAGLLIVRGSTPQSTGTFVDGTDVPLIYHFGGLSSVVPTELLDKIDFYPGNFSVRYGRYTGGIVDAGLRAPNTDCYGDYAKTLEDGRCYHGMAQVDVIDGRLLIQGPIPGTKNWSFAIGGRRSWIDAVLKPILKGAGTSVTTAPVYYDYQVIVERNLGPDDKLSFRLFGSDDALKLIVQDPAASDPGFSGRLSFGTSFTRGQVLYQKQLTPDTNIDTMLSVGVQRLNFGLGGNLKFQLDTVPIDVRSEIGHRLHRTAKVNVGLDFQMGPYDVYVRAPPIGRAGEAAAGPLATQVSLETQASGFSFRPAWYTDVEWQPTERLRLVPGVRLDYARDSTHTDVSPRLNARYTLFRPEDRAWFGKELGTVLKAGIGKFSQPPQFQETDEVFGTPGVKSNQSIHYAAGFEQDLTRQLELSMEGYYKQAYSTVSSGPSSDGSFVYNNDGTGHVIGIETLLKYNADDRFFGWVAYTLSRSVNRACEDCELRRFQYDQTHNLTILGSYRLGRGWEFGARFRLISGPLVTPVNPDFPALYAGDAGTYVPLQGTPNSKELPVFHQLDIRVDKRFQFRTWQFSTYLDVQNVYNHTQAEAYVYNYNFSQSAYQTGLPIIPSLGVRGEF